MNVAVRGEDRRGEGYIGRNTAVTIRVISNHSL